MKQQTMQQRMRAFGILITVLLSLALGFQAYLISSSTVTRQFNARLRGIVTNIRHNVDAEDLWECVQSGEESEKFREIQPMLNQMVDDYEAKYLYLCIPLDDGKGTMRNVASSVSTDERWYGDPTVLPLLYDSDAYTARQLRPYLKAWSAGPSFSYFFNHSDYGSCYTACVPIVTKAGNRVCLCCADVEASEVVDAIVLPVFVTVVISLLVGLILSLVLRGWVQRHVLDPVSALEESTHYFALKSHDQKDPEMLEYFPPDIQNNIELASLAESIQKMTRDMKDYVEDIFSAQSWARRAQEEAIGMSRLAYQDALTHMKSKAAYDEKRAELEQAIVCGEARFALVMVDLNNLKKINDHWGHENGNRYLIGSSKIIGDVFRHSPVYRVGGDEFVAVLQGEDYDEREALMRQLAERFQAASERTEVQPWERYSAAYGLAEYSGAPEDSVEDVYRLADERMYECKKRMKVTRE